MKRLMTLLLVFCMVFCGCTGAKTERPEGSLLVYYLTIQGNALVSTDYLPESEEPEGQVEELLAQMNEAPNTDMVSVLANRFTINSLEWNGSILKLYLEGNRADLTYPVYLLTLSALTRTLVQVENVNALMVYINGETVTDNSGRPFGVMRPVLFSNNAGRDEDDYIESEVTLFFANESGTRLTEVVKTVRDSNAVSPERTVLRQLIEGPDSGEGVALVPGTTSVLSLNTRDGVCYLNLDDSFVSGLEAGKEEMAIYSVVNSLTQLEGIDQVQFAINGNADIRLGMSGLSLSEPFSFNVDIVEIKE